MTKLKKILTLMACALVACIVVAGCGADYKKDFIGTWEICEIEQAGEVTTEEDLELLKSFGMHVYLEVTEEDVSLELFGESETGTWEATAEKTATVTLEGNEAEMTIDDEGLLSLAQGDSILRFKQIDASEKESGTSLDDTAESEDAADATAEGDAAAEETSTEGESTEGESTEGESTEADAA